MVCVLILRGAEDVAPYNSAGGYDPPLQRGPEDVAPYNSTGGSYRSALLRYRGKLALHARTVDPATLLYSHLIRLGYADPPSPRRRRLLASRIQRLLLEEKLSPKVTDEVYFRASPSPLRDDVFGVNSRRQPIHVRCRGRRPRRPASAIHVRQHNSLRNELTSGHELPYGMNCALRRMN